ncbi:Hexose carrier protein HEX6 [Bienertia sinuspersici]
MFQLEIRSAAQGITTVAISFIFTFLIAQTLLTMLCHFKAGIFFFFGGWIALMTAFVHLLLPQMKNVPLEKIHLLWKEYCFWSRIIGVSSGKDNPS